MYQRRYDKVYLMFKQETTGYSSAWGSCIMEIKNGKATLQISVQGLLPKNGQQYVVYGLLAKEQECAGVFCGDLPCNPNGQCTLTWAFDPDDLTEGYQVEDLFGVAVMTQQQGKKVAPLVAYFGQKREWLSVFCPLQEKADIQAAETVTLPPVQTEVKTPTMQIVEEIQQSTEIQPQEEPEPIKQPDVSYHGNFFGLLKKFRQEMQSLEEMGIFTTEETNRILGEPQTRQELIEDRADALQDRTAEKDSCDTEDEMAMYIDMTPKKFFENHAILYPFGDGKAWYQISLKELLFFDNLPLAWQKEPFFLLPYHRYGHLILREEEGAIWFGLPDFYEPQDKPRGMALGFSEFLPIEQNNGMGYWIAKMPAD